MHARCAWWTHLALGCFAAAFGKLFPSLCSGFRSLHRCSFAWFPQKFLDTCLCHACLKTKDSKLLSAGLQSCGIEHGSFAIIAVTRLVQEARLHLRAKAGACFLFSSCVLVEFGKASVTCAGARARTAVTCLLNLISPQSCSCLFGFVCSSLCLSSASCLCRFLPGRASSCSFATLLLLQPARPHAGVECELRL